MNRDVCMTPDDLKFFIQEGGGTTLEFKESLSSSLTRAIVALANTIGGKTLLGVRDDGIVIGVHDSNALRARIQKIARNCDPPMRVALEPVGGIFVVHVRKIDVKSVQCGDDFFWYQGGITQKLSRIEIHEFFHYEDTVRFDLSLCVRFSYPIYFDREKFDTWLSFSCIAGRPQVEDVLINMESAEQVDGTLVFRNAGALFFARIVCRFFPQAYITCLLARGTDKVHILDRKDFDGGFVADFENALHEAITNAVKHRTGLIEMTIPDKPRSKDQRYRLTPAGYAYLK